MHPRAYYLVGALRVFTFIWISAVVSCVVNGNHRNIP